MDSPQLPQDFDLGLLLKETAKRHIAKKAADDAAAKAEAANTVAKAAQLILKTHSDSVIDTMKTDVKAYSDTLVDEVKNLCSEYLEIMKKEFQSIPENPKSDFSNLRADFLLQAQSYNQDRIVRERDQAIADLRAESLRLVNSNSEVTRLRKDEAQNLEDKREITRLQKPLTEAEKDANNLRHKLQEAESNLSPPRRHNTLSPKASMRSNNSDVTAKGSELSAIVKNSIQPPNPFKRKPIPSKTDDTPQSHKRHKLESSTTQRQTRNTTRRNAENLTPGV